MIEHIATVRDRAITWDEREVVQHGLNSDTIRVDADSEFTNCDALALILCSASRPEPMRYMVDETLTVRIPSALMEQTGALSVCLIGYVGGAVRIVTKQERMPLVVVKSGETGGIDPDDGNPDLWGQLLAAEAARVEAEHGREAAEALRVAAETARVAAETEREKDSAAAVKAANDAAGTASKAAEKAKADTDAAIAKADAAEQARAGAETLRVEAENKRQQDTSTAIGNANKATSAANGAAATATSAASTATSAAATAEQKGIAAQEIADNIKAAAERGDFNGAPGAPGDKGDPGKDGTSPTASVKQTDTGAVITVTDAHGTTTAEIANGRDGAPGEVADNSVTNVKLADGAVNSRTLADGAVTRAKMAQDALPKAGAGISIADDGTVGFNGNKGTFYFENNGSVNMQANACANATLNGSTYHNGTSMATGHSTGTVHWSIVGQTVCVYPNTDLTVTVPQNWDGSRVQFARFATGRNLLRAMANITVARLASVDIVVDMAQDGMVTLSIYDKELASGKVVSIAAGSWSQITVPICGGGRSVT